jgi:hypothetical protein
MVRDARPISAWSRDMTDFLARLSARTLGVAPIAHPRAPSPFELAHSAAVLPLAAPSVAQDPLPQQGAGPSLTPLVRSARIPSPSTSGEPTTLRAAPSVGTEDGEHDLPAPLVATPGPLLPEPAFSLAGAPRPLLTDAASSVAPSGAAVPRVPTPTSNSPLSEPFGPLLPPSQPWPPPSVSDAPPTSGRPLKPPVATATPVATSTIPVTATPAPSNPAAAHEMRSRTDRHHARSDAPPKIQVTIGRVEVRAPIPARALPRSLLRSLDDYLKPAARN